MHNDDGPPLGPADGRKCRQRLAGRALHADQPVSPVFFVQFVPQFPSPMWLWTLGFGLAITRKLVTRVTRALHELQRVTKTETTPNTQHSLSARIPTNKILPEFSNFPIFPFFRINTFVLLAPFRGQIRSIPKMRQIPKKSHKSRSDTQKFVLKIPKIP